MKMITEEEFAHLTKATADLAALQAQVNSPITADFLGGTANEIVHQVQRWGTSSERGKEPSDWFWLVGYLAGKALHHHKEVVRLRVIAHSPDQDPATRSLSSGQALWHMEKALHHTISTAAALGNWHAHICSGVAPMAPGKSDLQRSLIEVFSEEVVQS